MPRAVSLAAGSIGACNHLVMEALAAGERQAAVRIGDAERDACVDELVEHHAQGRLTLAELDQRQTAALAAVTSDDLTTLLADLPGHRPAHGTPSDRRLAWPHVSRSTVSGVARWAAVPFTFAATGVVVASVDIVSDERQFAAGVIAAGVGYVTHLVLTKRPQGRRQPPEGTGTPPSR